MATKYYAVLTNVGAAKLANATALGAQVEITQMAVGDGNGVLPTPNPAQTALVHELRRKPLNSLSIDPNNANQIIAEQVIPEDEGGWWIREIGLFDKDGDMIAVANCAETYKPQLQEGSGRVQVVRMILIVSSTAAVTLKIDPSVVLATRQYVDDQIIQVKSYVDQKMAAHVAAADPHKQYAPKESPALTGRPTAPTAEGKDSSTQIANTAFVQAAIAALVGSSPEALDTLNELAAALGNDPNFATTVTNSLAGKMDKSANGSDIENVSVFLQNLGLDRFVQTKGNPNMRLVLDDASWYVYDDNLKKNIALAVNMGGTGALDAAGARTNLELGNSATKNTGTTQGTVAAGDDSRITGALQKTGGDVTGALRRVGSYPNILLTDSTMDDTTIGKTVGIEQSKGRLTFYLRSGDGSSSSGQVLFNMPDITGSKTLITKEECDVRYQQQTRLGAESRYGANDNYIAVPAGCVMTGLDVGGGSSSETFIGYRPVQVNINGSWATINQL